MRVYGSLNDYYVMGMRYYEYLSSAKVDMLFPQIDRSSKVTGAEIGIDVKVLKLSRRTDGKNPPSVYEKLAEVEDWIYAHEPVGTVDEPAAWIYGRMRLAVTVVTENWLRRRPPESALTGTVLFAGENGDGACILMGGSARHLHHPNTPPPVQAMGSLMGSIPTALGFLLHSYPDLDDPALAAELGRWEMQDRYRVIAQPAAVIINTATDHDLGLGAVDGEFEFLSKRLQTATSGALTASLATPLFVARID